MADNFVSWRDYYSRRAILLDGSFSVLDLIKHNTVRGLISSTTMNISGTSKIYFVIMGGAWVSRSWRFKIKIIGGDKKPRGIKVGTFSIPWHHGTSGSFVAKIPRTIIEAGGFDPNEE